MVALVKLEGGSFEMVVLARRDNIKGPNDVRLGFFDAKAFEQASDACGANVLRDTVGVQLQCPRCAAEVLFWGCIAVGVLAVRTCIRTKRASRSSKLGLGCQQ